MPVAGGSAEGTLLGGNLTLLARLVGTPFLPDLTGAILFLEEIGEEPYRLDGLLAQLDLAGILAGIGGLVLGGFTDSTPTQTHFLPQEEVLAHYAAKVRGPVAQGLVYGHFPIKNTLPVGVRARLTVEDRAPAWRFSNPSRNARPTTGDGDVNAASSSSPLALRTSHVRLAVFASGSGSNFGALLNASPPGSRGRGAVLIADRAGTGAAARAQAAGIPVAVLPPARLPPPRRSRPRCWTRCRGWTSSCSRATSSTFPPAVVRAFDGRMLNIHPALLPAHGGPGMYGRRVHEAVLAAGDAESGCTVHLVSEHYDDGPILAQVRVPVLPGDTPETLAARVLAEEHRLYPAVIATFVRGDDEA